VKEAGETAALVVVATPLGNLGDITRRAVEELGRAETIYCEDTRRTRTLLSALGIAPAGRLVALHEHNEVLLSARVVADVAAGATVALVTDAGTPGISDPGARVVAAVAAAGLRVTTTPGPSAVVAALSISGLRTERFVMDGFVPRKAGERRELYDAWAREERTIVAYESPQRLAATLAELAEVFPARRVAIVRELTKIHEEVLRGTLAEVAQRVGSREVRGEIVLVLDGAARPPVEDSLVRAALVERLGSGASLRDAVAGVVADLGVTHREAYEMALAIRAERAT
jgi:16S rRNA (cytidine1402-2'-O)-methyltransferase